MSDADATASHQEELWMQQLQAYVAWVNSQLKKSEETKRVEDLGVDLHDGVILAQLISIIAGGKLEFHRVPSTTGEKTENVQKVLDFMVANKIRMHAIQPSDIVEGNLKSIMRLILALAAHYKPSSVRQAARSPQKPSVTSLAQGAAAAIAEARQQAAHVHVRPRRPRHPRHPGHSGSFRRDSDSDRAGGSEGSQVADELKCSPRKLQFTTSSASVVQEPEVDEELLTQHDLLVEDVQAARQRLLDLQSLLLSGEAEVDEVQVEGNSVQERLSVVQSRLLQSEERCRDLNSQLSALRTECMRLQASQSGTDKRISEREEELVRLRADVLRQGFVRQTLKADKVDLERCLADRDLVIDELKRELVKRDHELEDLLAAMHYQGKETDSSCRTIQTQIDSLFERMSTADQSETSMAEELAALKESIHSFRSHDSDLDQTMHNLMERLAVTPTVAPTSMKKYEALLDNKKGVKHDTLSNGRPHLTKVLYFTDRMVTPFMVTVPKKLGDVRLRDVKAILDRKGNYRYHFKAMDPEFGTVKEEISNEDDIVPGWEGKIIAWIEEDHG